MGIENVAEFLSHLQKSVPRIAAVVELGQSIPNDPPNKACRISRQLSKVLGVTRARLLSCAGRKLLDQMKKLIWIVPGDHAICACITLISTKGWLGEDDGSAKLLAALKQPELEKIACRPAT